MFSRIATRTTGLGLRAQRQLVRPTIAGMKTTTSPAQSTGSAVVADNKDEGILSKFGLYPLVGLGVTALCSKEIYILNEESFLILTFGSFCMTAYIAAGDSLHQYFEGERQTAIKDAKAAQGYTAKIIEAEIAQWKASKNAAGVIKQVLEQTVDANEVHAQAEVLKAKHALRKSITDKLDSTLAREAAERAAVQGELVSESAKWVREQFATADQARNNATIENAINCIGDKEVATPADKDPVKMLFAQYFAKKA